MKKIIKKLLWLLPLVACVIAGYWCMKEREVPLDRLQDFCITKDGKGLVYWQDEDDAVIALVDRTGKIEKDFRYETDKKSYQYRVVDMTAGNDYIYVLRNRVNSYNGKLLTQELMVLNFKGSFPKEEKVFDLTDDTNYTYKWANASGDTVTLIATDSYETTAARKSFEFGSVLNDTLTLKNTRIYPLKPGEGIYQAMANSTNLVYISDSGKVYCATEEEVKEVYPARSLSTLMYPSYIAYAESGFVYMGEHESGDIIRLNISNGEEEVLVKGSSPFNGSSIYTPRDVAVMSMSNLNQFMALVKNGQNDGFTFLIAQDGIVHAFDTMQYGLRDIGLNFLFHWLKYMLVFLAVLLFISMFALGIRSGHTIMERLVSGTVPMMAVTMILFGIISFGYYEDAINENFVKQTVDEGNMLAALFGQESFHEIEYPYDYSGEAYSYLSRQMAKRELYTRAVCYENGQLYLCVDSNSPCFYPFDIMMAPDAESLYMEAAMTGEKVTGMIEDKLGRRLVCITPIGGLSGEIVYLLETGVNVANIEDYTSTYIKDFLIVSIAFLIIMLVILLILFYRILFPLGEMKRQMQLFADGNHSIRIKYTSEDELTGIANVFNQMADDIDVKDLNQEKTNVTYYRFIPPSIIHMLGEDNLAAMTLGTHVKGVYAILNVRLYLEEKLTLEKREKLINRFFNTVNRFAKQNQLIPIVDDANMQSMMLISQEGADQAAATAMTILARIDADNKLYPKDEQLDVLFVMDQTEVFFGICGDEERYIPAVFAPEFEKLLGNEWYLRAMGSRLLLTKAAHEDLVTSSMYANRYVGRLQSDGVDVGLYDIYDDRPADQIHQMKQTQKIFDKAMELYEQKYYYEAKNLLAMVLRENPQDMVAKYYIFRCEELQVR